MKTKELKRLRGLIKQAAANSGEETVERDQLLKADREFEKIERSGKLDRQTLFYAVQLVAEVLNERTKREQHARQE